ncbi:MAG: hypothetical protein RLZZ262_2305 [Bacteroidota bacterium]
MSGSFFCRISGIRRKLFEWTTGHHDYISGMLMSAQQIRRYALFWLALGAVLFVYFHSVEKVTSNDRLIRYIAVVILSFYAAAFAMRKKWIVATNLIILFILVLGVEIFCYFSLGRPGAKFKDFSVPALPDDHISRLVGSMPEPDSIYTECKVADGDTFFDVRYTMDSYRKRFTPGHDSSRSEYAAFFGCSIAFGFGVEDTATFPYYFQQLSQRCNAYNFATSSHGTNHVLAKLQNLPLKTQVREQKGMGVYVFFWDHVYRSLGTMARHTDWLHLAPNYELKDGRVVRNKLFKDGRPIRSALYEWLYQDNIVKKFELDFPLALGDSHLELVTEMIAESKRAYAQQFGNDEFIVLIYPNYIGFKPEDFATFKAKLKAKGIRFVDLSTWLNYGGEHTLKGDAHPSPATHKMIAGEFIRRLNAGELD